MDWHPKTWTVGLPAARFTATSAAFALAAVAIVGCDGRPDPIVPEFETTNAESLGALFSGELVVDGSCICVESDSGTRWLPVFPSGTVSWDDDRLVNHSAATLPPGVRVMKPGDEIIFGGGEIIGSTFRSLPFTQEPHWACDAGNVWMVGQRATDHPGSETGARLWSAGRAGPAPSHKRNP